MFGQDCPPDMHKTQVETYMGFVNGSWSGSIFNTVEYPELLNNSNITNIFTELMS